MKIALVFYRCYGTQDNFKQWIFITLAPKFYQQTAVVIKLQFDLLRKLIELFTPNFTGRPDLSRDAKATYLQSDIV